METFTLWHHHYDAKERSFSFIATAVNVQGINRGTDEMVRQMFADMAIEQKPGKWTLSRCATDYLSDDRDSDQWQDRWMESAEIRVEVDAKVDHSPPPPEFDETTAFDETWKADESPPEMCLIVADFKNAQTAKKAHSLFDATTKAGDGEDFAAIVRDTFSRVPRKRLTEFWKEIDGTDFSVEGCHDPLQLHLRLPSGKRFFEKGALPALALEDLIAAIGGTTSWRERYD